MVETGYVFEVVRNGDQFTQKLVNKVNDIGQYGSLGETKAAARDYLRRTEDDLSLPCVDPMRTGVGAIVDRLIADRLVG